MGGMRWEWVVGMGGCERGRDRGRCVGTPVAVAQRVEILQQHEYKRRNEGGKKVPARFLSFFRPARVR